MRWELINASRLRRLRLGLRFSSTPTVMIHDFVNGVYSMPKVTRTTLDFHRRWEDPELTDELTLTIGP